MRAVEDEPHPSLAALAQLSAVGFEQMPAAYAVLTWTSPHGRALPVAYVNEHVAGAVDGWTWCVDLVRALAAGDRTDPWTADFPARLARLAPSCTWPWPPRPTCSRIRCRWPEPGRAQRWYDGAYAMLEPRSRSATSEPVVS